MAALVPALHRMLSENSSSGNTSAHDNMSVQSEMVRDLNSVDFIIHEPIRSGFLLKFCNSHFCSENMRFVMEVDRFRDLFHADRKQFARKPWKILDIEHRIISSDGEQLNADLDVVQPLQRGEFFDQARWPGSPATLAAVSSAVDFIWAEFLAENAPYWICIPSRVLMNTVKRLKLIHVYGRDAFCEALLDPVKTIQRDIQPRFLASDDNRSLRQLLSDMDPLPAANTLRLPKPPHVIFSRYSIGDIENGRVSFKLEDLVDDRILFPEFLRYLEQRVSSENLRCVRTIQIFREARSSNEPRAMALSLEYAWAIYKYFVAPGSAYGISMSHRRLKDVMRSLAEPHLHTFDAVQKSAYSALRVHFIAFQATKEYADLYRVVVKHKDFGALVALAEADNGMQSSSGSQKLSPSLSTIIRNTCFPAL